MDITEYRQYKNKIQREYYARRKDDPTFKAKRRKAHDEWIAKHPEKNREYCKKYQNAKKQ